MATDSFKIKKSLNIEPIAGAAPTAEGDIAYDSTAHKASIHNGTSASPLVTEAHAQTLTNKTLVTASNTVTTAASGNLAATELNAALAELQTDIDTRSTSSALSSHEADTTSIHGITDTADLLTTSNTKTLTNKSISGATNTLTAIPNSALDTISAASKVSNSATTATDANTVSAIVARDGTGKFAVGGITLEAADASRALVTDANKLTSTSATTATEIGYVSGVTSAIQTQLNAGVSALAAHDSDTTSVHGIADTSTLYRSGGTDVAIADGGTGASTAAAAMSALSPITTTGDMIYSSSGTTNSRLGIGSAGQILKVTAGVPAWGAAPAGGINYMATANNDAEVDVGSWAAYADAAAVVPVDGTAGSPNTTVTRSTSSPLRGTGSFILTKSSGASRQGEGAACAFTIDAADKASVLQISFDYKTVSGTFTASDGRTAPAVSGTTPTAGNSTIEVWVYDVTNSVLIPVSPQVITSNSTAGMHFKGTFQTASSSTSYRLIMHCASNVDAALVWMFDNVYVGPQVSVYGPAVTDWTAYTPTISAGFGTTSNVSFFYARQADYLLVRGTFTGGTSAASLGTFTLPAGLALDTTKISIANTSGNPGERVGYAQASAANQAAPMVTATGTSTALVYLGNNMSNAAQLTPTNVSSSISSSQVVSVFFSVPISGWSSTTQMSNDTDTRVVAASATGTATGGGAADAIIVFPTLSWDTHGAYSTSTGRYTAPVSGFYRVTAYTNASNAYSLAAYVNAVSTAKMGTANSTGTMTGIGNGSAIVKVVAGDLIDVRPSANMGAFGTGSFLYIERLSGPSAIAATDSVNARYYASATGISGSLATISWTTKDYDSHGAMSSGTYTVPTSGKYQVNANIQLSGTFILNNTVIMEIQKNGTVVSRSSDYAGGAMTQLTGDVSDIINCVAGDTLRIQVSCSGTSPAVVSSNFDNYVSISRVGN